MTFVIGDVHGELKTLQELINNLPKDAEIIFVGDLIDRGPNSKEVIAYIRENNFKTVLGNHEDMMIAFSDKVLKNLFEGKNYFVNSLNWLKNGGLKTLESYGIVTIDQQSNKAHFSKNKRLYKKFFDDVRWLRTLPLYIQLDNITNEGQPIVVSHAPIADQWHDIKNNHIPAKILWNRKPPEDTSQVFNIFGHSIVEEVDVSKGYINVDTGCHKRNGDAGKLSAYCIETKKVISVNKIN